MTEKWSRLSVDLIILNVALACIDGFIAVIAFTQLVRIHMRSQQNGWTRQKVLHLMVGSSNLGYIIYFISTVLATCEGWICWSHVCGFILMAYPKILFLAAFLLLLSFWVDLCHQANEEEEDDDDENSVQQALLENLRSERGSAHTDGYWKFCSFQGIHIGGRQKYVVMVVALIFVVMMIFAILIGLGIGNNPLNPSVVAQVYEKILACMILLLAGALGCYSLLLFFRLRKVRSEKASSEIWKVASLAIVSVICFCSSALVGLLIDIPPFYPWHLKIVYGVKALMYLVLYHFIGSSVASAYLLWIIKELPPPNKIHRQEQPRAFTFISHDHGASSTNQPQSWATVTSSKNQGSRASPI